MARMRPTFRKELCKLKALGNSEKEKVLAAETPPRRLCAAPKTAST